MTTRIIVKSLPKKISEDKLKAHFAKVGVITEAKLKYTKDGKFRQFAFVGYKNESDAEKAIEYFNNTYIDASKIIVESCRPLNDDNRPKAWSKYSKEAEQKLAKAKKAAEKEKFAQKKQAEKMSKAEQKEKKLEKLIGDLKDDQEFKEFLAANKAISSTKDSIWKNDFGVGDASTSLIEPTSNSNEKASKKKKNKKKDNEEVQEDKEDDDSKSTKIESTESKPGDSSEKEIDFENGRLFVRNLSYECKEEELEKLFTSYGPLVECSMPLDNYSKRPKGFAYITCMFPEKAIKAYKDLDGSIFQGRMLHIMAAQSKREMDEEEERKLGFKQKKDRELKKKSQLSYNWNSLFINQNALANLISKKYNIDKSELYDVHQTGGKRNQGSVAVKLAVGETQIVNDIRKFLVRHGVKLDSFNDVSERSKTVMLIKNLPNETSESDLKEFMKKNGLDVDNKSSGVKRFIMPEYGIAALIEFNERQEARDAFKKLAYRKFKTMPLYLEWAPVDIFDGSDDQLDGLDEEVAASSTEVSSENKKSDEPSNLKETTNEKEKKTSTNIDSSTNGGQSNEPNKAAGTADRKTNKMGKQPNVFKTTKILVRNIPFEAKVKEVEELFRVFGELKYVRLPKKMDGSHRGFGFVDFITLTDAERAFEALCYSTHLFGRRLVLEWAQPEQNQDVEILRQKESQIYGPTSKRLKKSKLLDDLGREEDGLTGPVQMEAE